MLGLRPPSRRPVQASRKSSAAARCQHAARVGPARAALAAALAEPMQDLVSNNSSNAQDKPKANRAEVRSRTQLTRSVSCVGAACDEAGRRAVASIHGQLTPTPAAMQPIQACKWDERALSASTERSYLLDSQCTICCTCADSYAQIQVADPHSVGEACRNCHRLFMSTAHSEA